MSKSGDLKPSRRQEPPDTPCVSRRRLLGHVAFAASAGAALIAIATSAEAKMTQKGAGYQSSPKNGDSCATCTLFKPPSSCILVGGTVSPNGWCRFYAKKS
jgi:hypothetical protein